MAPKVQKSIFYLFSTILIVALLAACAPQATLAPTEEPTVVEATPAETAVLEPTKAPASAAPATEEPTATAEPKATKLTVWLLGNSGPGVEHALPGFKEKYPNIEVDMQVFGWNDLLPKLQAALTAGSGAPDVVEIFSNQMPSFMESGAFLPLNKYVEPYKNDLASYAFLDVTDPKGNIYALVWSITPSLLFYRSDIFEREGVDPASLKTWDDLIEAGKKVTHDDQYMFLTASQSTQPQYFNYFTGMLSELGGSIFDVNGNITINEGGKALKVLQTLEAIEKAKISMDVDAWWTPAFEAALKSGKVASFVTGAFHISILKTVDPQAKGMWRIQLAPTFTDGKPTGVFTAGGRGLAIPTQSKNQDAAWAFIEYMMLNEQGIKDTWEGGAIIPSYKPAYSASYFDDPDPYFGNQAVGRVVMDGMKALDGATWFSGPIPSGVMANEIVGPELRDLMTNKKNAEEALSGILNGMEANMP